nr:MAG TPA: hypothetical protein [Caudoviricetes sp.]
MRAENRSKTAKIWQTTPLPKNNGINRIAIIS